MIVTISREYGSAALDVAHELEHRIGYRVVAEDLPAIAAIRLGAKKDEVAAVEGRRPSILERILGNLGVATPETQSASTPPLDDFETLARKEIEKAVREAAESGDATIVGRIANMVLRERDDILRVFLYAPIEWRVARVQRSLDIDAAAALREIDRYDGARRRYAKVHYDLEWGAVRYYDLALNVALYDISGTAEIIASAVHAASRR